MVLDMPVHGTLGDQLDPAFANSDPNVELRFARCIRSHFARDEYPIHRWGYSDPRQNHSDWSCRCLVETSMRICPSVQMRAHLQLPERGEWRGHVMNVNSDDYVFDRFLTVCDIP